MRLKVFNVVDGDCCGGRFGSFLMFFYPLQKLVFCRINSYGSSFCHYFNDFLLLFPCGHGIGFLGFSRAHVISILCLLLKFFASN